MLIGISPPYYPAVHHPDPGPAVEAALAGHSQYRQLTEQYADLIIEETRQNIAGLKKKAARRKSVWLRRKKSNG